MKKKILLYAHGGSGNHGCEAIVRSTYKMLAPIADLTVLSHRPQEDRLYGLDKLARILPHSSPDIEPGLASLIYRLSMRVSKTKEKYMKRIYRKLYSLSGYEYALSIGGDNYCYRNVPEEMVFLNRLMQSRGMKTILWGCSLEPDLITPDILNDLRSYYMIYAREHLTAEYLDSHGIKNVILAPDPAFVLPKAKAALPKQFIPGNTIGINISPLIFRYESKQGIALENYRCLIRHVLQNTDMSVALIPHVVWHENDDREALELLRKEFPGEERIFAVPDCSCEELKAYISQLRFLITARTHASIAAYSEGVPALVIGYSTKAKGIAEDIFGTSGGFVVPVQELVDETELLRSFLSLQEREKDIQARYKKFLPHYVLQLETITAKLFLS